MCRTPSHGRYHPSDKGVISALSLGKGARALNPQILLLYRRYQQAASRSRRRGSQTPWLLRTTVIVSLIRWHMNGPPHFNGLPSVWIIDTWQEVSTSRPQQTARFQQQPPVLTNTMEVGDVRTRPQQLSSPGLVGWAAQAARWALVSTPQRIYR